MIGTASHRGSLACRDLGFGCEWSTRAGSVEEATTRFREHAKCAHAIESLSPDLAARVTAAFR